jgi:hypothetical protein
MQLASLQSFLQYYLTYFLRGFNVNLLLSFHEEMRQSEKYSPPQNILEHKPNMVSWLSIITLAQLTDLIQDAEDEIAANSSTLPKDPDSRPSRQGHVSVIQMTLV